MKKGILFGTFLLTSLFSFATGKGEPQVAVNVVDADSKKPVAEVTITAIHSITKAEHTFTTDANGQFKISQLPQGTYKFKFEKDNYKTFEKKEVTVKTDATIKLSVEIANYKDEDFEERHKLQLRFDL